MKDNLENKVDNITKVIGNIKMDDLATKSDLNSAFNELIKSLESVNIETNEEFARKFLEAFQVSMDEKHKNLQAILNDFEKQIFEIPKADDSKFDYEVTKITSDINAIYSKMEDQEAQFEKLIKGFDNISKNNPKKDFDEIREDLDSFAKGFGNSANTIIKHFNDFTENLKEYSGKEEFNKLFDNLEILSNNTSLIISAIGIIDSKYKDMTDVVELITNNENAFGRTLEELRASKAAFDDFTPTLRLLSTKEDMDIIHKQLDILNEAFIETKKYIDSQVQKSDDMKVEEKQREILSTIENLQENLSVLNKNLISLGESCTNNFGNEENEIKNGFSKLSEEISDVISQNKTFFDDGIAAKVSLLEDNLSKISQENYVKIYNKLNESIENFEASIKEKDAENKNAINNSVASLQEEIGILIDNIKNLKESFTGISDNFTNNLEEPIKNALENVNTQNIEIRLNDLSAIVSQTIEDFKNAFDNLGDKMLETSKTGDLETIEKINETVGALTENIASVKEEFAKQSISNKDELKEKFDEFGLEIKGILNDFINSSKDIHNSTKEEFKETLKGLEASFREIGENITKISEESFFENIIEKINKNSKENLQNLSNTLSDNIENMNMNVSRDFVNQREILNSLLTKVIETSTGQTTKLDVLTDRISEEARSIKSNIASTILQNSDSNNTLMSDALASVIEKIIDVGDSTNANLNKIEEKIKAIPQDLTDGQITMLADEFGNMTNKLEQINLQQINNSKELMIELQNIVSSGEDDKNTFKKIIENTEYLKGFEEKIEKIKIDNLELLKSYEDKIESLKISQTENMHSVLDEVHTTTLKQISQNDSSKQIIDEIKDNLDNYAKEIKTNIEEYSNDLNLKGQQIEAFQNNLEEEIEKLFEKQTKIFSAAFQKTLNAQNPKDFSLALERIYSKLNTIATSPKAEEDEYDYTLKDVESDLAKLRLILEKNPNLEVVQHLSALRNTIGDTVKVNQNVDQQLSYVNNWLRTAAKTMEILARKVDKAEKTNTGLSELKELILSQPAAQVQNTQNIDTSDIEHAIANTFKKFKIQEMKLESIEDKINSFLQKAGDEPDIKGFINALYDNMAQTKALNNRMDSIEIQLNGLQRNMEKIITYFEE